MKEEILVLSLLCSREMYGYEITSALSNHPERPFDGKLGSLYPLLHTLEKGRWIQSRYQSTAGGQERKYYRLTKKGRNHPDVREAEWAFELPPAPFAPDSGLYKMKFDRWCRAATARIRFVPDRMPVMRELQAHMEDHYSMLLAEGADPQEAVQLTLDAMGSPEEIAPQFAVLHKPFWGYAERIIRWVAIGLTGITIAAFGFYFLMHNFVSPTFYQTDSYAQYTKQDSEHQILYLEPGDTVFSDGYALTLSKVVWEENGGYETFRFQIRAFTLIPWAEHSDIGRWFEAEDSLGNYYYCVYESGLSDEPSVMGNPLQTGPFTCVHNMWLSNFCSQDAEYLLLRYDRAGREIVFRIDLTGGQQS